MLNEFKKSLEALLPINDRDIFKGLGICKLGTQIDKKADVFQKRQKS